MELQTKKYKDYMSHDYTPIQLSDIPYVVDHRGLKVYADKKGMSIASLPEEEKRQFIHPNPDYNHKGSILGKIAVF